MNTPADKPPDRGLKSAGSISLSSILPSEENRQTAEGAATQIDPLSPAEHLKRTVRRRIGEFEIVEPIGEGAICHVYLAWQPSLQRHVALKVNKRTGGDFSEGILLANLEHENIVKVYSAFLDEESGARVLCLQYVPGADLHRVIEGIHEQKRDLTFGRVILESLDKKAQGKAGFDPSALRDREALASDTFPQAICRIGGKMAEALAFAHARGILHCDIKPANILMTPYGRPMLADFNVSFDRDRHPTPRGGTLPYMPPEQRQAMFQQPGGHVDERSDIFSLGVVLYELATGKLPTPGFPELAAMPRELAAVIGRCLEGDAAKRYQTASELAAALAAAAQLLAARRALPPPGRIGRWVVANPGLALALAAVMPHVIATLVNIAYNLTQIPFKEGQLRAFPWVILGYNLFAYPACVGTACLLCLRIARSLRQPDVDATRRLVRRLGWWAIGLAAFGWLPGGIVFPFALHCAAESVEPAVYLHFIVSFTLAGLIGVVFSYLLIEYVAFQAIFPRLGNPDTYTPAGAWAELRPLTAPFGFFQVLACAVPLTGAVLLLTFAGDTISIGSRVLVVGLIGAGVAGVGIAERVTRKLRALAAVWQRGPEG